MRLTVYIVAPYSGKYYVWADLWPPNYTVPAYCNGQCTLLNEDAAERIYTEAMRTDRHGFRLEDFFYIGILRAKSNISDIKATVYQSNGGTHAFCEHLASKFDEQFEDHLKSKMNGTLTIPPQA